MSASAFTFPLKPEQVRLNPIDLATVSSRAAKAVPLGLVLMAVGMATSVIVRGCTLPQAVLELLLAYLVAFCYFTYFALGALVLLMIQYLTGGHWGLVMRRVLEAGTRMIVYIPLFWLPVAAGAWSGILYEWTHPGTDPVLLQKAAYLNLPFWTVRSILYFVLWYGLAARLNRLSKLHDETGDHTILNKLRTTSGPGIVLYGLSVTFASVDWLMSLEPHWYSTIYPAVQAIGQILGALSLSTAVVVLLARFRPMSDILRKRHMHDYGKFMLGFTMFWAYVNVSQFLIIWAGNLPEEIPWYLTRLKEGWQVQGAAIIAFHFVVPFLLLLSQDLKKNPRSLVFMAFWIIAVRYIDLHYAIVPSSAVHFAHSDVANKLTGWRFGFLDIGAMLAVGGVWTTLYLRELAARPLLPVNDPYLEEALSDHGSH